METRYIYGNEIYIWKRDIYGNVVKIINVEIRKGKEEALFFTPLSLEPDNVDLCYLLFCDPNMFHISKVYTIRLQRCIDNTN